MRLMCANGDGANQSLQGGVRKDVRGSVCQNILGNMPASGFRRHLAEANLSGAAKAEEPYSPCMSIAVGERIPLILTVPKEYGALGAPRFCN